MDDHALVAAMARKDPVGLDGAYRRYADRLFAYSRSMLHDPDAAADVVHDTFVLASVRIGQLRQPDRLRPWLYAIARHECHRVLRTRANSAPYPDVPERAAEGAEPGANLLAAQVRELVAAATVGLSDTDREVVELALRHDLSAPDVGAVLGVSSNHAHALLSRARGQLKVALSALVLARGGAEHCAGLAALLRGWDGRLTQLLRKRIGRHAGDCIVCTQRGRELLSPEALLPAYAAPAFLAVAETIRHRAGHRAGHPGSPSPADTDGSAIGSARPRPSRPLRRLALTAALAAVAAALLVGSAVLADANGRDLPVAAAPTSAAPAPTSQLRTEPAEALTAPTGSPTTGSLTTGSLTTGAGTDGSEGSSDPAPSTEPFTLTIETWYVSCQDTSYSLRVTAQAHGASVAEARIHWGAAGSSAIPLSKKMTRIGTTVRSLVDSLHHSRVGWWVDATATDGRTAQTATKYATNPCSPSIGGLTS